jgi:hypothetical protein
VTLPQHLLSVGASSDTIARNSNTVRGQDTTFHCIKQVEDFAMQSLCNLKNKGKNNQIEILILALAFAGTVFILIKGNTFDDKTKYTDIFSFVVLALTLATLIYYARDTHRIADTDQKMWELELQPRGIYEMQTDQTRSDRGRTIFTLGNMSDYVLDAKVLGNFRVYNELVQSSDPAVNGEGTWTVYPHQLSRSYFEIEPILRAKGHSIEGMQAVRNSDNYQTQLTMDLEIEFTNDMGQVQKLPARRHFFDFESKEWVPRLLKPLVP